MNMNYSLDSLKYVNACRRELFAAKVAGTVELEQATKYAMAAGNEDAEIACREAYNALKDAQQKVREAREALAEETAPKET